MLEQPGRKFAHPESVEKSSFEGEELLGSLIGSRYRLEKLLGGGGMGKVFLARHVDLHKTFALKLISARVRDRPEAVSRFQTEALSLGRLDHAGIVRVSDYGLDPGLGNLPYLVMEYLPGKTLGTLLEGGPPAWNQALAILMSVAEAMDFAHENGIIHRDLKPANIFIMNQEKGPPAVKIVDFGLARILDSDSEPDIVPADSDTAKAGFVEGVHADFLGWRAGESPEDTEGTRTAESPLSRPADMSGDKLSWCGTFLGTPQYLAPEVVSQKGGSAADMYAFGLIAFELLTGKRPFSGNAAELIRQHLCCRPPAPSSVCAHFPPEADRCILDALQKDPALRPHQAKPLVAALEKAFRRQEEERIRKKALPCHLALSLLLVILFFIGGKLFRGLPLSEWMENQFFDWAGQFKRLEPLDPRIVLTLVPEEFWTQTDNLDAERFSQTVEAIFAADAAAVSVDLILPERFSRAPGFARLILRHGERIRLSRMFLEDGRMKGMECVQGLIASALGLDRLDRLFCYVNVQADGDGIVRRYRLRIRDQSGRFHESLGLGSTRLLAPAVRTMDLEGEGIQWLNPGLEWSRRMVPWEQLEGLLERDPANFRGTLVFIGGKSEYQEDVLRLPPRPGLPASLPGLAIHANITDGLLHGRTIQPLNSLRVWLLLGCWPMLCSLGILRRWLGGWFLGVAIFSPLGYIITTLSGFVFFNMAMVTVAPVCATMSVCVTAFFFRQKPVTRF